MMILKLWWWYKDNWDVTIDDDDHNTKGGKQWKRPNPWPWTWRPRKQEEGQVFYIAHICHSQRGGPGCCFYILFIFVTHKEENSVVWVKLLWKKFQVLPGMEAEAVPTTGVEAQQMPPKKVSFFKAKESKFLRPKKVSC